jgi:hypothetical protein
MGLDANGIALAANLPVSVDEIIEGTYIDATTFHNDQGAPVSPSKGKIYMDTSVSPVKQYRWGGTNFGPIDPSPGSTDAVPEGLSNFYFSGSRVLATVLAGLDNLTALAVNSGDSILVAIGKLQAQFNTISTSIGNKLDKGSYTGTAQDLKALIDQKETPLAAQSKADQAETNAKAYADGLLKQGIAAHYADTASMIAAQANQEAAGVYFVTDATGDPTVISGFAYYEYLGTTAGDLTDYRKLSEEESMDVGGGVSQQYVNDQDAATLNAANAYADAKVEDQIVDGVASKAPSQKAVFTALGNKVEKDGAKVLSDVNFTTAKDSKLNGIASGATVNDTDANLKNRANHSGTQTASTISDFAAAAQVEIDKLGAAIEVNASRNFLASDNGKILMITATVTLTMPSTGLQNAFRCDLDCTSTGQATIAKDAGAVVLNFPAGQILEAGKMATIYRKPVGTYANEYRGKGEFKV